MPAIATFRDCARPGSGQRSSIEPAPRGEPYRSLHSPGRSKGPDGVDAPDGINVPEWWYWRPRKEASMNQLSTVGPRSRQAHLSAPSGGQRGRGGLSPEAAPRHDVLIPSLHSQGEVQPTGANI